MWFFPIIMAIFIGWQLGKATVRNKRGEEAEWSFFAFKRIKRGDNGKDYLNRLTILQCPWFSIKLHHIKSSDDDCPHDHPWGFTSIILKGGYFEFQGNRKVVTEHYKLDLLKQGWTIKRVEKFGDKPLYIMTFKKWYGPGSIIKRPARWIHRLELKRHTREEIAAGLRAYVLDGTLSPGLGNKAIEAVETNGPDYVEVPAWTLVFTGKRERDWGFHTPGGWLKHDKYNYNQSC